MDLQSGGFAGMMQLFGELFGGPRKKVESKNPKIAVIYGTGAIMESGAGGLFGGEDESGPEDGTQDDMDRLRHGERYVPVPHPGVKPWGQVVRFSTWYRSLSRPCMPTPSSGWLILMAAWQAAVVTRRYRKPSAAVALDFTSAASPRSS